METKLKSQAVEELATGWIASGSTLTYASTTTFTISGDQTGTYEKGLKLKLTNDSTVKYFYVLSSSYSSPDTTVTITGETLLASGAIILPYLSRSDKPSGFKKAEDYYRFRGYASASQTFTQNSNVLINVNTETFDINSNFDTSTHLYTAPISGYYQVNGMVKGKSIGSGVRIASSIKVGASYVASGADIMSPANGNYPASVISDIVYVARANTIGLGGFCTGSGYSTQPDGSSGLYLSIQFLGL